MKILHFDTQILVLSYCLLINCIYLHMETTSLKLFQQSKYETEQCMWEYRTRAFCLKTYATCYVKTFPICGTEIFGFVIRVLWLKAWCCHFSQIQHFTQNMSAKWSFVIGHFCLNFSQENSSKIFSLSFQIFCLFFLPCVIFLSTRITSAQGLLPMTRYSHSFLLSQWCLPCFREIAYRLCSWQLMS